MNAAAETNAARAKPNQAKVIELMTKPPAAIVSLADSLFVALAMHQLNHFGRGGR